MLALGLFNALLAAHFQVQTYGNPNLISDILPGPHVLYLATSAGILVVDSASLEEIDRLDRSDGLPYPVVLRLLRDDRGLIWGVTWNHGVFVWDRMEGHLSPYRPPQYLPSFDQAIDLAIHGDTLALLGPNYLAYLWLRGTPTDPSDDSVLLYGSYLQGAMSFHTLRVFGDSLFIGTEKGLYVAPWADPLAGALWSEGLPDTVVYSVLRAGGRTFIGTGNGIKVWETGACYLCGSGWWVPALAFRNDTLYAEARNFVNPRFFDLSTGQQSIVDFPGRIKDVRVIYPLGNRVLFGFGWADMDLDYEAYNYGFGLGILDLSTDSLWIQHYAGPFIQKIRYVEYRDGTLWLQGRQERMAWWFYDRTFAFRGGEWLPLLDSARVAGATAMALRDDELWLNNFLNNPPDTLVPDDVSLFAFDSSRTLIREVTLPLSNPKDIMTFIFDNEGDAVLSLWQIGLGRYIVDRDSFVLYPLDEPEILSLFIDHRNWLWIGTTSGLRALDYTALRQDGQVVEMVNDSSNFLSMWNITCFADDGQTLWIGSWSGLAAYDGQRFRWIQEISSPVFDIDPAGSVIGVLTQRGLYFLDRQGTVLDSITPENALLPDTPGQEESNPYLFQTRNALVILPDSGVIWMGTLKGLVRITTDPSFFQQGQAILTPWVYPNPVPPGWDSLFVTQIPGFEPAAIFDLSGYRIASVRFKTRSDGFVVYNLKSLSPGLYIGVARKGNQVIRFKFAIVQ